MNNFDYKPSTINHKLILVGTNHKFSPVEFRERISFSKKRIKDAVFFLKERGIFKGAVILSTCNRVEIYASVEEGQEGFREIENFISQYHEINIQTIHPYFYRYIDKEAIKHLFLVTSGLDSLILGETQILDQVKSAFFESEKADFMDDFLRQIFNSALYFAKKIHAETNISEGKISVGSVAIDFIREKIGNLKYKNILIVGVGKVTELVLKYLEKEGPNVVFVSNRNFQKAKELASQINANAVRFDDLKQSLKKTDIVITATASPHFIIREDSFDGSLDHKLLILDLAIPRDVDPRVKELENVELFYLEELTTVIYKNIERKKYEVNPVRELRSLTPFRDLSLTGLKSVAFSNGVKKATEILNKEVDKLWNKLSKLELEPALLP